MEKAAGLRRPLFVSPQIKRKKVHPMLKTERLLLLPAKEDLAPRLAEYYRRNRDFLRSFEPPREEDFFTAARQRALLVQEAEAAEQNTSRRFYLQLPDQPDRIVGMVGLNNIVWGAFCSCFLGYKLDGELTGQGYMTEAVAAVTDFAFTRLRLHRIEANVMPRNRASLRVLEKNGYINEGLSRYYLNINGVWEDHVHMVRINFALHS